MSENESSNENVPREMLLDLLTKLRSAVEADFALGIVGIVFQADGSLAVVAVSREPLIVSIGALELAKTALAQQAHTAPGGYAGSATMILKNAKCEGSA